MNSNDLVTIILSIYNETTEMISKSISSILNQTYKNIELILVNDNPDRLELDQLINGFIKIDNRIVYLKNKENKGLVFSLNYALKYAKGNFIARMDADDISLNDRIEKQICYINANQLDMIGSGVILIDENDKQIGKIDVPQSNDKIVKLYKFGSYLLHPTWFVRKEVYISLKGYRNIFSCEDYDFVLRAILKNVKFGNIAEPLLKYRIRSSSISNSSNIKQKLITLFLRKNISRIQSIRVEQINEYLLSNSYKEDYQLLEKYISVKNKIKTHNTVNFGDLFSLLINKYFYFGIYNFISIKYINKFCSD